MEMVFLDSWFSTKMITPCILKKPWPETLVNDNTEDLAAVVYTYNTLSILFFIVYRSSSKSNWET